MKQIQTIPNINKRIVCTYNKQLGFNNLIVLRYKISWLHRLKMQINYGFSRGRITFITDLYSYFLQANHILQEMQVKRIRQIKIFHIEYQLLHQVLDIKKELKLIVSALLISSGYQDSNLGPPAPKAGALTGLRYTPFLLSLSVGLFLNCDAKVRLIFEPPNF